MEHVASAAFRQWLADSHCNQNHGYGITVRFTFGADTLDDKNWVIDFGSLKPIKQWIEETFDHRTLVSEDDPQREWYEEGARRGILTPVFIPAVGCEKFAELIYEYTDRWLDETGNKPRVWIDSVEVLEHSGNSAIFKKTPVSNSGCGENCSCKTEIKLPPLTPIPVIGPRDIFIDGARQYYQQQLDIPVYSYENPRPAVNSVPIHSLENDLRKGDKPCDWCSSFDFQCTGICETIPVEQGGRLGLDAQDQGC
jgi:6-pyruvoyltetrahydropterin/6-carboxytetrahydropterin synthase